MTCNPNWPEIKNELKEGQTPQDRPDLVARVFKLKKDQLMQDLKTGHALGKVVAYMYFSGDKNITGSSSDPNFHQIVSPN